MDGFLKFFSDIFKEISAFPLLLLVLLLPFLLLLVILLPIRMFRGFRKGAALSLISLTITVVALFPAVFLAKLIARPIAGKIYSSVLEIVSRKSGDVGQALEQMPYAGALSEGLMTALVASGLFLLLYFVFLLLGKLILGGAFRLAFAVSGAKKHLRVIGMVIGAVDALLLSFFFLLPLYSTVNSVATVAKDFSEELAQNGFLEEISKSEGVSLEKDVSKVTDSVLHCPPVWLASKVPFNFCTGYFGAFNMEGTRYNAFEVIDHSAVVIADGMKIATLEADTYKEVDSQFVRQIGETVANEKYICGLVADFCRYGESTIEEDGEGEKELKGILAPLAQCGAEDVQESIRGIARILDASIKQELFRNTEDKEQFFKKLGEERYTAILVSNIRSGKMISEIFDNTVFYAFDRLEGSFTVKEEHFTEQMHSIKGQMRQSADQGVQDVIRETRAVSLLSNGLSGILSSEEELKDLTFEELDVEALAEFVLGFCAHPYVSEESAEALMRSIMPKMGDNAAQAFRDEMLNMTISALKDDLKNLPAAGEECRLKAAFRQVKESILFVLEYR